MCEFLATILERIILLEKLIEIEITHLFNVKKLISLGNHNVNKIIYEFLKKS